jgi:hypothetical protein
MSRLYESAKSKEDELRVAKILCAHWGYRYIELKPTYEVDFALMRFNDVGAMLEVRKINFTYESMEKYGGCLISPFKYLAMQKWQKEFNLVMIFAIEIPDGIYALIVKPDEEWPKWDKKIKLGGMSKPRDKWDIEPLLQIPMKFFRKILDVETIPADSARSDHPVGEENG